MPNEIAGQVPIDAGQEPTATAEEKGVATEAQAAEEERFDAEYVKGLRRENAAERKRRQAAEARAKELEDAQLSETERMQNRLAELERQQADHERERQEWMLRRAVESEANAMGLVDADAAYKLLDMAQVEYAEDGKPKNLKRLLASLVETRPWLVAGAGTSATNPARQTTLTLDTIRHMTPEEINQNWDAVQAALSKR